MKHIRHWMSAAGPVWRLCRLPSAIKVEEDWSVIKPKAFPALRTWPIGGEVWTKWQCSFSSALCLPFTHTNWKCAFRAALGIWRHQQALFRDVSLVRFCSGRCPCSPSWYTLHMYLSVASQWSTHRSCTNPLAPSFNISASNHQSQPDAGRYVYHIDIYTMKDFSFSTAGRRVIETKWMLYTVLARSLVPCKTMHYHLTVPFWL